MAKGYLEELLIQVNNLNEETKKLVDSNSNTFIDNTMADAVKSFIQEAVADSEDEFSDDEIEASDDEVETSDEETETFDEFEEEDIDGETGESFEDETEFSDEEDSEDFGSEDEYEMGDEESEMDDENIEDTAEFEDEEEVLDMTSASLEEVMDFIENSDDEVVVKIVKKPTYSVSVENEGMSDDIDVSEMDDDTEIEIDDDMLAEVLNIELSEEEQLTVLDPKTDSSKIPGYMQNKKPFGLKDEKGNVSMVQAENRQLKKQIAQLKSENNKLKLTETKSVAALKNLINQTKKLALVNSNLAYVSRLFTEHVTTKQEKVEILKAFDSNKTIEESQKKFKVLNESLSKKVQKKTVKVDIKESKDLGQQKVINEEKTFVEDPTQAHILKLMNYKSSL